jgi:hypothetical protein
VKRIGPELKMPKRKDGEIKVPPFVSDFYADLRDRRLLPLIALLLVAIVATPVLLADGSDEPESGPGPDAVADGGSAPASARSLTVVKAAPGLRNYKKRLDHRHPTDPFNQRFDGPQLNGAQLNEPTTTSTTTTSSTETTETVTSAPSTTAPGSGSGSTPHRLTFFTWGINVWINKVPSDPEADAEGVTKPGVLAQTPLPGTANPVVTFMGLSRDAAEKHHEQRALFVVSDEVSKISEGGKCLSRGEGVCQLIEVKPDVPITFLYGPGETRYTLKVLKIALIVTGHS